MKFDIQQIKKFIIGGGSATLLHYLTMALLIFIGMKPLYATTIGAFFGAVLNYILQYHYTFESDKSHLYAILSYVVSVSFGFIANTLLFALLYESVQINLIFSQLITTAIITVLNYILYKYIVFKPKESH